MNYTLKRPCAYCPFLKEGGIRLSRSRVREIGGGMLKNPGITFQCHATVDYGEEDENGEYSVNRTPKDQHCAGALIFAEKQGTATQMMRIAERLGMYDAAALMADTSAVDGVFDSLSDMLNANAVLMGTRD